MKSSHIWRNCLIKELNIPDVWKNPDGQECNPPRKDLFWVIVNKDEAFVQILKRVRNADHLQRITETVTQSYATEYTFLIARDLSYIQYYPYFSLNGAGVLWEKFGETYFSQLTQLADMEVVKDK